MSWKEYAVWVIAGLLIFGGEYLMDDYNHVTHTGYVGANGHDIILQNNANATDPTSQQVYNFVKNDETNYEAYTDSFQCGDFAEKLHNNAEAAGLKCGWVSIHFKNDDLGHACNVFNTTDKGFIFIDCVSGDASVDVKEGQEYIPCSLTDSNVVYESGGVVERYNIKW
jgi:hypothetical protein